MSQEVDKKQYHSGGWSAHYVMIVCTLLFVINYMDRQVFSAVLQPMKIELGLSDAQCGLAYSIYSAGSFFDDAGDLVISAGLDTGHVHETLRLVLREMKRLAAQLVPASELRRARDYLLGQLDLSLENSENQMMWAGEQWLGYGKIMRPDEFKRRLSAVTASQVRAVARELFRPDRYNLALISPLKTDAGLEKILSA